MMDYQNDKDLIKSSSDPLNISFENLSYSNICGVFSKSKFKNVVHIFRKHILFVFTKQYNKNNN